MVAGGGILLNALWCLGCRDTERFEDSGSLSTIWQKRNVTMVELSNEMLETYGMTRYKSITIKDDPEACGLPANVWKRTRKGPGRSKR